MLEKAIILADMCLDYIRAQYPADDPKFTALMKSIDETMEHLKNLEKFLADTEHAQKSAIFKDKCPCPRCDQSVETERAEFATCLKEVALKEIKGEAELVYERDESNPVPTFENKLSIE